MAEDLDRNEYIGGLRQLANWLELHPEVPLPQKWLEHWHWSFHGDGKETAQKVALAMNGATKEFFDTDFRLVKSFGAIVVRYHFNRDVICERKVVGTKIVPELHIPEHEEDIVEWDCGSLLGDGEEKEAR